MVSIVRAGVSCLPIISPFVDLYNKVKLADALSDTLAKIESAHKTANSAQFTVKTRARFPKKEQESFQKQIEECEIKIQNTAILEVKNSHIYSVCSLVGHVLSIALAVSALALNILPGVIAGELIFFYSFSVLLTVYELRPSNRSVADLIQTKQALTGVRQALQAPLTE